MLTPTVKCFYARRVLACVSLPLITATKVDAANLIACPANKAKHRDGINADKEQVKGNGIH